MTAKVSDRLVEIVALVTIPLISTIGYLVIDELKEQNANQKEMRRELSEINGFIQVFVSELATVKGDVREINVKVDGNTRQINILRGLK